ncbi:MAG: amidohydrolase [Chloroflexota bacterium]
MRALASPQATVMDLKGRTVTPGFVDAHNHLAAMGLSGTAYIDINPPGVNTVAQLQEKIAEGCAKKGSGKWVIAQGYISYDGQYPDKTMLDSVSPDNPVMLVNQGGHMGAVNSYALKMAGVTAATPDPKFGIFVRDQNGEPTGALINHSAMDVFRILWYEEILTPEIRRQSVIGPQSGFASFGVTSFGDVNTRGLSAAEAYFNAARNDEMTIRAYILNTIEYFNEIKGRPEEIEAMRFDNDFMRFGGFKFLLDGAGVASYMHEPTKGTSWDMATWDPKQLNEAVRTFHDLGYQCSCHAIGDAAVDMGLDAYEEAISRNPRPDPRHRLEHAVLNTDEALKRQRDLGIVISTQPHIIRLMADLMLDLWGEERAMRVVPTRSWLELGIPLSISSDAPTFPWWQPPPILSAAVSRLSATNIVFGPDQVLTIDEAMRAYTMGGAYADFEEDIKGSLETGKLADLVVWRLDPYSTTLKDMTAEHPVDVTILGGKTIFERA